MLIKLLCTFETRIDPHEDAGDYDDEGDYEDEDEEERT